MVVVVVIHKNQSFQENSEHGKRAGGKIETGNEKGLPWTIVLLFRLDVREEVASEGLIDD